MARVEGFEPPSMVLETTILPLNYTRIKRVLLPKPFEKYHEIKSY